MSQHNDDNNLTRRYNNASDSIGESPRSDTHSCQDDVNTKIDTRVTNDATIEDDGMSNVRHASNLHDTDSRALTEVNIPTNQKDEPIQDETFSRGGNCNLQPNPNRNFSNSYRY